MKWLQSEREVSKTATMSEISRFIKVIPLSSCHSDASQNTKDASADTGEDNNKMHYSTNNSNNTNNSSNNAGSPFTHARSHLISLSFPLVQLFYFLSPLPWEAVTIRSHFVHIKQGWRIKCRCQQRRACWLDDWHWTHSSSKAWPVHCMYTDSNGLVRGLQTKGACSLPSCPTQGSTV